MIKIKRGLDVPISGAPEQRIEVARAVRTVAVIGFDYQGMKPTMAVQVGDPVKLGQVLFSDKRSPGVVFTAPGAGRVSAIHRGEKRVLQSVTIDLEGDEQLAFDRYTALELETLGSERVRANLQQSGLWTALRTRPFSQVPKVDATPAAIFVTAIDTHPLAADPALIIAEQADAFAAGLKVLGNLAGIYLCKVPGVTLPGEDWPQVRTQAFAGPHPAGLVGTHIHFLEPVGSNKQVWHIGYQDVIAVGILFLEGRLAVERVVALGGPVVSRPRLLRTRLGASLDELCAGELEPGDNRIVSGSVLGGRTARGACAYLGRYHQQISCLKEGKDRELLHYLRPGLEKHSILNVFISKLMPGKRFALSTSTNGSPRAMVPVGNYEAVMPLDILPTQLLRALIVGDLETALQLGCLELDEEDLALCSYVCAGKYEYGPILRDNLTRIEKEG